MGPAVLRPEDGVRYNRSHVETLASHPCRPRRSPNPNPVGPRRRKRTPLGSLDNINGGDRIQAPNRTVDKKAPAKNNLVMGQVKILKRGEKLQTLKLGSGDEDLVLSSMDRLGPEPDTVQKQVTVSNGLYAGSASFFASPPPSSLPFPAFTKKEGKCNDVATSDLCRLLRLDLI